MPKRDQNKIPTALYNEKIILIQNDKDDLLCNTVYSKNLSPTKRQEFVENHWHLKEQPIKLYYTGNPITLIDNSDILNQDIDIDITTLSGHRCC